MQPSFTPSPTRPAVIRARHPIAGHDLWLADKGWSADPRDATQFQDEAIADLALLHAMGQPQRAAAPYLAEPTRQTEKPLDAAAL